MAAASSIVRSVDEALTSLQLALGERPGLVTVVGHRVYSDEGETEAGIVDPQDRTTLAHWRRLVQEFLAAGYRFVSPSTLAEGTAGAAERCAMLTLDDGYFHHSRLLPLLQELDVPAVFFISPRHVMEQKAFWWDVLYRERRRQRVDEETIAEEIGWHKGLLTEQIERRVEAEFGPQALRPVSDLDRSFTAGGLREFASDPHVSIGNHTVDHAILTNYTEEECRWQIGEAQRLLTELCGQTPQILSYPCGMYSDRVVEAARASGLSFAVTSEAGKVRLPVQPGSDEAMRLKRFVPRGYLDIERQCRHFRRDWGVRDLLRKVGVRGRLGGKERRGQGR